MRRNRKVNLSLKPGEKCTDDATVLKIMEVSKMVAKGDSYQNIIKTVSEKYDIGEKQADRYYNAALKYLAPSDEELDDYRKAMLKIQMNRLEKIMDKGIDSNDPQMLNVAKAAIAEMNKILFGNIQNQVTLNKNKDGDEQIIISFGKE